jgi:hypothetical protein
VEVHVEVQRRTEALYQRHRSGRAGAARKSGLLDQVAGDRPVHHTEHERQRCRIAGQQEPQRMRQREHPLPQRALRQDLIGQRCRGLGHAPRTA